MQLSEQEQIRRDALNELKKLGINPYPQAEYKVNAFADDILKQFPEDNTMFQQVSLAGRIVTN